MKLPSLNKKKNIKQKIERANLPLSTDKQKNKNTSKKDPHSKIVVTNMLEHLLNRQHDTWYMISIKQEKKLNNTIVMPSVTETDNPHSVQHSNSQNSLAGHMIMNS